MTDTDYAGRIRFDDALQIMEVDFSGLAFQSSAQVNAFYDVVDEKIQATGTDWYFMVNYQDCHIDPNAWVAFSTRGKRVNIAHSRGTVRFNLPSSTGEEIEQKSRSDDFDPNLCETREDALMRILEMRRASRQSAQPRGR